MVSRIDCCRGGQIAIAAGQERQATVQPLEQDRHRQDAQARCRQLDRQREPIQPPANLGDRRNVLIRQLELRIDAPGSFGEELDRIACLELFDGSVGTGERERWNADLSLTGDAQAHSARDQHRQPGTGGVELRDERRRLDDLLQIVEDQQELA